MLPELNVKDTYLILVVYVRYWHTKYSNIFH